MYITALPVHLPIQEQVLLLGPMFDKKDVNPNLQNPSV
jgi:hypothetical protein